MTQVWHEFHDLPDTPTRKQCWMEVSEYRFHDGRSWRTPVTYWSSSKASGCDLPLEYDHP